MSNPPTHEAVSAGRCRTRWATGAIAFVLTICATGAFAQAIPGNGWSGPLSEPGPIGSRNDPGYWGKVVARWDAVPFQTFSNDFELGIIAFHMNGIDRVEFSVDNGPWIDVTQKRRNPRTGVWEYWITLDPDVIPDGEIEVRAIIYPKNAGHPRVLQGPITGATTNGGVHSMILTANGSGTQQTPVRYVSTTGNDSNGSGTRQNPFRTIFGAVQDVQRDHGRADGATILLEAGDYELGPADSPLPVADNRWITIKPASGVSRSSVRITGGSSGGLKARLVKFENLTVYRTQLYSASSYDSMAWVDRCVLDAGSRTRNLLFLNSGLWTGGIYGTDTTFKRVMYATNTSTFMRGCTVDTIGVDAFKNPRMLVNCTVKNIDNSGLESHPDVIQFWGSDFENIIVYGFTAVENALGQGIFSRRNGSQNGSFDNSAFVNILIDSPSHTGQWQQSVNHVLFWHVSYLSRPFWFRDDSDSDSNGFVTRLRDISIRNCVFEAFFYNVTEGPSDINITDESHFIDNELFGRNATGGNPRFVDRQNFDFRPGANSPLRDRISQLPVRADLEGHPLDAPASIGPLQPDDGGGGGGGGGGNGELADVVTFGFHKGTHVSGSTDDLRDSDNQYVRGNSEIGFTALEANVLEVEVLFDTYVSSPLTLDVAVESKMNNPMGTARISLKNWNDGNFQQVAVYPIGLSETTYSVNGLSAPAFVRDSGRIRMMIKHTAVATFSTAGFDSFFDRTAVSVY